MTQWISTDEGSPRRPDAHAMHCAILDPYVEQIWPALLEFRAWLLGHPSNDLPPFVLCYRNEPGEHAPWQFAASVRSLSKHRLRDAVVVPLHDSREQVASVALSALPRCERLTFFDGLSVSEGAPLWTFLRGGNLPGGVLAAYRLYLPFLLGQHRAMLRARPWVSAHLAQTLDARIATLDGHSQWINNEANRVHAHRLRAVHDAVLVGRTTVERDDPRLTVREVRGASPLRVVIDRDCRLLSASRPYRIFSETGRSFVLHAERLNAARDRGTAQPDVVTLALKETQRASGGRSCIRGQSSRRCGRSLRGRYSSKAVVTRCRTRLISSVVPFADLPAFMSRLCRGNTGGLQHAVSYR